MGKYKEKEELKRVLTGVLTVGQLKEFLKEVPDDTPVGVIGHYGEILFCSEYDPRITDIGYVEYLGKHLKDNMKIFTIDFPYIGPEPD